MSVDLAPHPAGTRRFQRPVIDIVVPVYNEEKDLEPSVRRLHAHLSREFPYSFRITIADNASTDGTPRIAAGLAAELSSVTALRLTQKGRGRALRAAWSASDAQVLAYCDVDLSTDLAALLPLVAPLISGHSDLAIGTRLSRGSRVVRGQARAHLPRLQPPAARHPRRRLLGRPMRVQGGASRRRAAVAAAGGGHRLVLRHRAAGAG